MSINLTVPETNETPELKPRITVIGVGGAGGNAVNNMIRRELEGVDFVVANTDAQSLTQSRADRRIQLGTALTQGLGAGSKPEVGRAATEEAIETVMAELDGSHMAFIAAGMGGGTGTGSAPVIARAAKESGILTVGVVTKPFQFEGTHRMRLAEAGIRELEQFVDTLIIIPNQNLFRIANENTTFADAFAMADEVLYSGVRGVTDLMVMPGLINLDFADIRSVMSEMGKAMMGTGEAEGERRALDAAEAAIANPLLDDTSMKGAKGVLINITGGEDITLFEVDEAATRIRSEVDQDAYIIIGSAFDASLQGCMRVSVVATGIDADASSLPQPTLLNITDAVATSRPQPAAESEASPEREVATTALAVEEVEVEDAAAEDAAEAADTAAPGESEDAVAEAPEDASPAEVADEPATVAETADDAEAPPEPESEKAEEAPSLEPAASESGPEPEETPAAMPAAGAADAFIPPRPVSSLGEDKDAKPDPFAAAAMTNGAEEPPAKVAETAEKPQRPSLFERVTRTGRAALERGESAAPAPARPAAAPAQPVEVERKPVDPAASTGSAASMADPAPVTRISAATATAEAQPDLGNLAPAEAEAAPEEDEDLLDIPAFLRRQAN